MKTSRLFIAIETEDFLKTELKKIQNTLKKSSANVKWVKPENIHLTLKFLDETPDDKINSITEILNETAGQFSPFDCTINHLGAFPNPEYPEIIWIGIEQNREKIKEIALQLEEKLEQIGFKKESREFSAHITLGRLHTSAHSLLLSAAIRDYKLPLSLGQMIKEITLFQSTLTSQGPVYEILKKARLKEG